MKAVLLVCESCRERWHLRRWYLQCFECGHVYRTRWHLLAAYRRARGGAGGWWRPSRIYFCQCCIHDF